MQVDLLNIGLGLIVLILTTIMIWAIVRLSSRTTRQPYGGTPPFIPEQTSAVMPGGGYRARYTPTSLELTLSIHEKITPDTVDRNYTWNAKGTPDAVIEVGERMAVAMDHGLMRPRSRYLPPDDHRALGYDPGSDLL